MIDEIDYQSTEARVMSLMCMFLEHALAVDRLEALGRATPETINSKRREGHAMRVTLLRLADLLDGKLQSTTQLTPQQRELLGDTAPEHDPDGAAWIRSSLTPDGLAAMKAYHDATRQRSYPVFGDPE